jgi:hypothetical protein
MRYWIQALGVAAFIILFGLIQWGRQGGGPQAGDTVMPQLERPVLWTAGASGEVDIRLYAKGENDRTARLLDFGAIPLQVNPLAQITFYEDDQPLGSLEVALSHRC